MRTIYSVLVMSVFVCFVFQGTGNAAQPEVQEPAVVRGAGEIVGQCLLCGQGVAGTRISLRGINAVVIAGPTGEYHFYVVPEGTYEMVCEVPGQAPRSENVTVTAKFITLQTINFCPDNDGDGFTPDPNDPVNGGDCNDNNPNINPDAEEVCDGLDNNCDNNVDEGISCPTCTDSDNDGFFAQEGCGTLVDCNDNSFLISPGVSESCDGVDNNCNGLVDEGFDADNDGFTICGGDCNDSDRDINPNAEEVCGDGIDNNCNNEIDDPSICGAPPDPCNENDDALISGCGTNLTCLQGVFPNLSGSCQDAVQALIACAQSFGCSPSDLVCAFTNCPDQWQVVFGSLEPGQCVEGATRPCGTDVGECQAGTETCSGGTFGACVGEVGPQPEICDGLDNNCNIGVDDNPVDGQVFFSDGDGDGFGAEPSGTFCTQPEGFVANDNDCDDSRADINPNAVEICDGLDNNCDGQVDEGFNLNSDPNNCGACNNVCSLTNANSECSAGVCVVTSCLAGFGDCNASPGDGCEKSILDDPDNCGGCGFTCSNNHVFDRTCTVGVCSGTCGLGFADCNNDKQSDGCETDLLSDANNCGACGTVCAPGLTCLGGQCV